MPAINRPERQCGDPEHESSFHGIPCRVLGAEVLPGLPSADFDRVPRRGMARPAAVDLSGPLYPQPTNPEHRTRGGREQDVAIASPAAADPSESRTSKIVWLCRHCDRPELQVIDHECRFQLDLPRTPTEAQFSHP